MSSDIPLAINGGSVTYINYGPSTQTQYPFSAPGSFGWGIGYPTSQHILSIPKISEDQNRCFGTLIHYPFSYQCPEHALVELTTTNTSNSNLIQHPSIKLTSIANKGNSVYIGGDNYIAKACFSNCPVNDPASLLKLIDSIPDVQKCIGFQKQIGHSGPICSYVKGGVPPYSFSWSPSTGLSNPNIINPICTIDSTTQYILTITDSLNNSVKDTIMVNVTPNTVSNLVITSNYDTICANQSVTLNINLSYTGGFVPQYWQIRYPSNNTSGVIGWGNPLSYYKQSNWPGNYTFECHGIDTITGCNLVVEVPVYRRAVIPFTVTPTMPNSCAGDSITLTAVGHHNFGKWTTQNYNTNVRDTLASNGAPFVPIVTYPSGNYSVSIVGVDSNGCSYYHGTSINVLNNQMDSVISLNHQNGAICSDSAILLGVPKDNYCNNFSTNSYSNKPYIEEVIINNNQFFINSTGNGPGSYNKYKHYETRLKADSTYSISIKRNPITQNYYNRLVWIDFNHDGDFLDSLELVVLNNDTNIVSLDTINIPAFAKNGITRMRISYHNNSTNYMNLPCAYWLSGPYGEVEDYDIIINNGIIDSNYVWSPSSNLTNKYGMLTTAINNSYNTYTVTYLGDSCSFSKSISTYPTPSSVPISSIPNLNNSSLCIGDSIVLQVTGYQSVTWSNNVINSQAFLPTQNQQYIVSVIDSNGCEAQDSIYVMINNLPNVIANNPNSMNPLSVCQNDSTILWGSGAQTYSWNGGVSDSVFFISSNQSYIVTGTDTNGCSASDTMVVIVNNLPVVTANNPSNMNPLNVCQNDSTILWGSGAQTYSWNGGVSDSVFFISSNQSYIVTGTDTNGCSASDTMVVIVNNLPVVTANNPSNMNPLNVCQNDSTILWASGAQSYTWNGGVSDSAFFIPTSQSYIVTGTDTNGCSNTDTMNIIVNNLPTVFANSATNNNPLIVCQGDSILLWGSGAQSYSWTGGINDSLSFSPNGQNYIVTGTDSNGCSASDTVQLIVNALPTVSANSIPNQTPLQVCMGDSITLYGSGANSYTWNPSISDSVAFAASLAQYYVVTGTDINNCSSVDSIQVLINPVPNPTISLSSNTLICTNVSNMNSYNWFRNGLSFGGNSSTQIISQNGIYVVEVVDSNVCSGFDTLDVMNLSAGTFELSNHSILIYPNPTSGLFTIASDKKLSGTINILNLLGKRVYSTPINGKEEVINLSNLARGNYMIRIIEEESVYVHKLILR